MTDKTKTALPDPFTPFDFSARSRELEQNDVFNVMVSEGRPGDLRREIERLANAGDPAIIGALEQAGIDDPRIPKKFFLSDGHDGQPATIYADAEGWHAILETQQGQRLKFTSPDRERAMFLAQQHLDKERGPRDLSESERLLVGRLAEGGETALAIDTYVRLRLPAGDRHTERELLESPAHRQLLDDAAFFVFTHRRQDFEPSDDFSALVARVQKAKPLTVSVLEFLWERFQYEKTQAAHSPQPAAPVAEPETEQEPSPEEVQARLETLPDEQIEKLRTQTLRHRGHAIRRFDERMRGQ